MRRLVFHVLRHWRSSWGAPGGVSWPVRRSGGARRRRRSRTGSVARLDLQPLEPRLALAGTPAATDEPFSHAAALRAGSQSGPAVASIAVPAAKTYGPGTTLSFTVTFTSKVVVGGTPTLPVTIGDTVRDVPYVRTTSGKKLVFTTRVMPGDVDRDGIQLAGPIGLPDGATIRTAAGSDAATALPARSPSTRKVLVDAIGPGLVEIGAPVVSKKAVTVKARFNEAIKVKGRPTLTALIGGQERRLVFQKATGTTATFSYTLRKGESATNVVVGPRITLAAGASIRDQAGNLALSLGGPADVSLAGAMVPENSPAGTVVGTLSTTDADAGDRFAYALVAGDGSADNALFTIVGNELRTVGPLDYESRDTLAVRIRSTDAGGLATERAFSISVTDVDETPPTVSALALASDTGSSATDGLTNTAAIRGTTDATGVVRLLAAIESQPAAQAARAAATETFAEAAGAEPTFSDVSAALGADGTLTITAAQLDALAGGVLPDGRHTVTVVAERAGGIRSAPATLSFTLDRTRPSATLRIAAADSSDAAGSVTAAATVVLTGATEASARIAINGTPTLVGPAGSFQLPDVTLTVGANAFGVVVTDAAGNAADPAIPFTFTRTAEAQADAVLEWNAVALRAIQRDVTDPPVATRTLALVSIAQFDALAAISGTPAFLVQRVVSGPAHPQAAAAAAAHRILSRVYPAQQAAFDAALAASLADVPDGTARDGGIALGVAVADAVFAARTHDGSGAFSGHAAGQGVGRWQPTGPMYDVPAEPHWRHVTPFAIASPEAYRPDAPPPLDSGEYAAALAETQALGGATSGARTAEQTELALFWADGGGSFTPPGHWNDIAADVAEARGNSLSANARLMAQLNVALADAAIACWDAKYTYALWRPETAIRRAADDGNAATVADASWRPLLITPAHPEYVSGHSTFSAAAAEILAAAFGDATAFTTTTPTLSGVELPYASFSQAVADAGRSRIYGGIHYEFSNQAGQAIGRSVADAVLARFAVAIDTAAPAVVTTPVPAVTATVPTITGQVLDTVGAVSASYVVDGGPAVPLAFAADGSFTIPAADLVVPADGPYGVTITASDAAGNTSAGHTVTFTVDRTAPLIELPSLADGVVLGGASRLTGTAAGTGSPVVLLTYRIGTGPVRTLALDRATGDFDTPLDFGSLAVGDHTLTLTAQDAAGNTTTLTRAVTVESLAPFALVAVTPAASSIDVGVTQRPQVVFSRAVDPATLTQSSLYATGPDGARLGMTIVPAADGMLAWLFPQGPMPGGATVTVHVEGSLIRAAADGALLDADGDGTASGRQTVAFSTVSRVTVPGTTLTGRVVDPGPDLEPLTFDDIRRGPDGVIHTPDDVFLLPIAGAKVFILGLEDRFTFTAADGSFTLTDVPAGTVKVAIDGRTATNPPAGVFFPEMVLDATLRPGVANTLMGSMGSLEEQLANGNRTEVYLPRIAASVLQSVVATGTTVITAAGADAAPGLSEEQRARLRLAVKAGSAVDANGQPLANVQIGIATVPPELVRDMLPPGVLQHTFDITIQAPGVAAFTEPLQITFPNVFGAAAGTKLAILSFDHTTGRLVVNGTGTVSADGLTVVSDPGSGITAPGWHGVAPPGSSASGGGAGQGGPCSTEANLALSAVAQCAVGLGLSFVELAPVLGCVVSFAQAAVGASIDCRIDPAGCWQTIGTNVIFAAAGCVPGGGLAISVAACLYQGGSAVQDWFMCELSQIGGPPPSPSPTPTPRSASGPSPYSIPTPPPSPSASPSLSPSPSPSPGAGPSPSASASASPGTLLSANTAYGELVDGEISIPGLSLRGNPFTDQARLFEAVGELTSAFLGTSRWTSLAPAEIQPFMNWVGDVVRAANAAGAAGLTAEQEARLLGVRLPSLIMPDDKQAIVDRMERGAAGLMNEAEFANVAAKGERLIALEAELRAKGWTRTLDSLQVALPEFASTQVDESDSVPRTGSLFYKLTNLGDGTILRGRLGPDGRFTDLFLAENASLFVEYYDPVQNRTGGAFFRTGPSGVPTEIPQARLTRSSAADTDGDALPDDAESIVGTDRRRRDTDGDGVSDLAALQQGVNPLGGRGLPTGVIAAAAVQGAAQAVAVTGATDGTAGLTAILATGSHGVAVIDATRPAAPVIRAELDLPGTNVAVAVDAARGLAAVAGSEAGLHIVSVADPAAPTLVRTVPLASPATRVVLRDGLAYVASGPSLAAIDLATGEVRQTLDVAALGGGTLTDVVVDGDVIFTMQASRMLRSVTVAGDLLTAAGALKIPQSAGVLGGRVFVGGGVAYVGEPDETGQGFSRQGFSTVDVSNPADLRLLSGVDADSVAGESLAATGSGLLVTAGFLRDTQVRPVHAIDVSRVTDPTDTGVFVTRIMLPARPLDLALAGGLSFVAAGTAGLQIVNAVALDADGIPPTAAITVDAVDADPTAPGIQVLEGRSLRVTPTVGDDVQVRSVELLVNGAVVAADVSFPFEFFASIPTLATGGPTATVQVRATDTGGNVGLSNVVTLGVVADTFAPVATAVSLTDGASLFFLRSMDVTFDEPLDVARLDAAGVVLMRAGADGTFDTADDARTPVTLDVRSRGQALAIIVPGTLPVGPHRLTIERSILADRAGNQPGADIVRRFSIRVASEVRPETGVAAEPAAAAANPGQEITLGVGFDPATARLDVQVFDGIGVSTRTLTPRLIDATRGTASFTLPFAVVTGDARLHSTAPGAADDTFLLQIVPTVTDAQIEFAAFDAQTVTVVLSGSGFGQDGAGDYTLGGVTIAATADDVEVFHSFGPGGEQLFSSRVRLTVPRSAAAFGGITARSAGGTSAVFTRSLAAVVSTALSGTPADPAQASANPGQAVTLVGSSLATDTDVVLRFVDDLGAVRALTASPAVATADGTRATLILPTGLNGAFTVQVLGSASQPLLQIVPVLTGWSADATTTTLAGLGLVEGAATYSFPGTTVTDAAADDNWWDGGIDVAGDAFLGRVALPRFGAGEVTVTTAGGTSAPLAVTMIRMSLPGTAVGDVAASADGTLWVADTATPGTLHLVNPANGGVIRTLPLPGGAAGHTLGLQVLPAAISLGGTSVPAGSLLVFNGGGFSDAVVTAIDPATGATLASLTVPGGAGLTAGAYAAVGGLFFVTDHAGFTGSRLRAIDPATGATVATTDVDIGVIGPSGLAIHPTTGHLWLGSVAGGPQVIEYRIDAPGHAVELRRVSTVAQGLDGNEIAGLAFAADGTLWAGSTSGDVHRIDLTRDAAAVPTATLTSMIAVAAEGTPADATQASANLGGVIELVGTQFSAGTTVLFPSHDNEGLTGVWPMMPLAVSADGTRLVVQVPDLAATGAVRVAHQWTVGDPEPAAAGILLQIVPTLRRIEGLPGDEIGLTLHGSGFMEAATTLTIGGVTVLDAQAHGPSFDVFGVRNDTLVGVAPWAVRGPIRVTTAGGFAEIAAPSLASRPVTMLTALEAAAALGTPADAAAPAANTAQAITLVGQGFSERTLVEFAAADDAGNLGTLLRTGAASADGHRLTVVVPALARTGMVRVQGAAAALALQVVPTLRAVGGTVAPGSTIVVEGTGLSSDGLVVTIDDVPAGTVSLRTTVDGDADTPSGDTDQQLLTVVVPDGVSAGRIRVTTAGGTAALAPTAITALAAVEASGTPAWAGVASANVGQEIVLSAAAVAPGDRVVFTTIDASGNLATETVEPVALDLAAGTLTVLVPATATTGAVRLERDAAGVILQIVPVVDAADLSLAGWFSGGGWLTILGSGFAEGLTSVTMGDTTIADNGRFYGIDVRGGFGNGGGGLENQDTSIPGGGPFLEGEGAGQVPGGGLPGGQTNDRLSLRLPADPPPGPISVTTVGGTSAPLAIDLTGMTGTAPDGPPIDPGVAAATPDEGADG